MLQAEIRSARWHHMLAGNGRPECDLKDLQVFDLALLEKRLHKVRGTDLSELRTLWQHRIARSLFFEAGSWW